MEAQRGGSDSPLPTGGTTIERTDKKLETMERSLSGDSTRDYRGVSSPGEPGSINLLEPEFYI